MIHRKLFPFLVFFALLVLAESTIALLVHINRPSDIPVVRGTAEFASTEQITGPGDVDAYMVENLRRTGLPGAILAIARQDRILYTAGYGYTSDGSQITPDTPMPVASLTKSFTAAAVMQLVEEEKLSLQNPVRDFLPEFELADPRGVQITVKQLLNQSSGLAAQGLPPSPSALPKSLPEQVEWLRAATLVSDPGTMFHYCNDNYNVLARVIERVGGAPYAKFLENRLFTPLGMHRSRSYLTTRDSMPGIAAGYKLIYGALMARRMPEGFAGGGGGAVSSANDLARWLVFQATGGISGEGKPLLSAGSMAAMHTASAPESNYGFGWRQESLPDGTETVHHSGKLETFTAHMRLFPKTGYGYAFVINAGHAFSAEVASFMWGMNAIMTGHEPVIGPGVIFFGQPFAFIVDNILAILTVLFLTIGIVGSARAGMWVRRRINKPSWRLALRLAPYAVMSMGIILLPWLMRAVNRGVAVPLNTVFSVWPPLVIFLAVAAASGISVLALRLTGLASNKFRRYQAPDF